MNSFRNIIDRLPKWLLGKKGVQSLLLVITILCTVISIIEKNHFSLNEAQILYLFSGMAQVIGGIFGLTLTAYIFFVDKFQNSTVDDPILYDATVELLNGKGQILRSTPNTAPLICDACNTQPEGLLTTA